MRRGVCWIGLLCSSLLLAGCLRRSPEGVAQRYLENLQQFNYAACYGLLTEQDRKQRTYSEFLTEIPLAPDVNPVWFRPVLQHMRFGLGPARRAADGVHTTVALHVTAPDLPRWERLLDTAAGGIVNSGEALRSLDRGDYPTRVFDDPIYLVKEHHHWRVYAGFSARDQIVDQHRQSLSDYLEQHYSKAAGAWRIMIANLENQSATGSRGLADQYQRELDRIDQILASQAERDAYASKMRLSGVAMKMSEQHVPAIFGAIHNEGNRAVDAVALEVTWYEGRGKTLRVAAQEQHNIVRTPILFTDFTRSVLPFIPGETRDFGFVLDAPLTIKQTATPYVKVSAVTLSDRPAIASKASPDTSHALQSHSPATR